MITVRELCKKYEDKVIFENYNLTVNDGEFVVICGKSGCGKTTLLNIIGGIEDADSGTVVVDGYNLSNHKIKVKYYQQKVGFLFQNFALVENMTVLENMKIVKNPLCDISIEEALDRVGLKEKTDKHVYKLSGGEQQRLALARIMIKKCDIILADEPTASLDSKNAADVVGILKELNSTNKTVIMVTHDERLKKLGTQIVDL